jgi:hypothetical protein
MDKDCAIEIRKHLLKAQSDLGLAAYSCVGRCSPEDLHQVQAGAGYAAGKIDILLFEKIYRFFPEMDHRVSLSKAWDKHRTDEVDES